MTRIIDITRPLRGDMEVYPGDPPVSVTSMVLGGARVSALQFGSHTGTHVDAPLHFVEGGYGVDELPLDALVGEVVVSRAVVPAERLLLFGGNLTHQPAYADVEYRAIGDLPVADFVLHRVFWVGVYPALDDAAVDWLLDVLHKFVAAH